MTQPLVFTDSYIPGLPTDAAGTDSAEVLSPWNRQPIGRVPLTSPAAAEHALSQAYALYRDKTKRLPLYQRIAILEKTAAIIRSRQEELALLIATEGQKPLVDARVEAVRAASTFAACAEYVKGHQGEMIPMGLTEASSGRVAFTRPEPIGVVLAISAFNHPLNLLAHQAGPALAAGCPVLLKPARATPLSAWRLTEILREAGLPPEWCVPILPGDHDTTNKLVSDPRVGFVSFIGSHKVGWGMRAKLAPGARISLEHGGVAPVFVAADADLNKAVPLITKGGYYHAGQVCISVQRVFIHESRVDEFLKLFVPAVEKLKVGDATDAATEVGPLINPKEVERVGEWVDEAVAGGAKLLTGGKRLSETTYAPTILMSPPKNVRISTEEVFGPVVCLYPYTDEKQALEQANGLPTAFQGAVFTESTDTAFRLGSALDGAAVMVNDHTAFRVDWMPFAGARVSGLGVGGPAYAIHEMQTQKLWVLKAGVPSM